MVIAGLAVASVLGAYAAYESRQPSTLDRASPVSAVAPIGAHPSVPLPPEPKKILSRDEIESGSW